jgi:hypothetical protein
VGNPRPRGESPRRFVRLLNRRHNWSIDGRSSAAVNNGYLWKDDELLNRVARIRYSRGDELTDLPGVTGIGIGKDHIILYVASDDVQVPEMVEDVRIIKIRRR